MQGPPAISFVPLSRPRGGLPYRHASECQLAGIVVDRLGPSIRLVRLAISIAQHHTLSAVAQTVPDDRPAPAMRLQ